MQTFSLPLVIQPGDIDQLGHVNNVVYLRWVQDVATAHWSALASPAMQAQWLWVVLRHEIDYLKAAQPGDSLDGVTWVGAPQGPRFDRYVEIRRGGEVLARARTVWCLVDASSMRPRRVTDDVVAPFRPFMQETPR